jgi:hypothetical protein
MKRYRLRRGALYAGATRYDFIGEIIETHTNANNGRQMFRLAFEGEPGASMFIRCWFYGSDLIEVTNENTKKTQEK